MKLIATLVLVAVACSLGSGGRSLTPETFEVDAGSYRTFGFEVGKFGRVFGPFRTEGTRRGNTIRVMVVDQDQFENFRSGREFQRLYDSGQVSEGRVDLQLRYGRYVIIFDNRASLYSPKTINSNLQLDE